MMMMMNKYWVDHTGYCQGHQPQAALMASSVVQLAPAMPYSATAMLFTQQLLTVVGYTQALQLEAIAN
jgi:hypothetical protein